MCVLATHIQGLCVCVRVCYPYIGAVCLCVCARVCCPYIGVVCVCVCVCAAHIQGLSFRLCACSFENIIVGRFKNITVENE